jgi:hypothetical protein
MIVDQPKVPCNHIRPPPPPAQPPALSYTIDVEVTSEAALRTCHQVVKNNHMKRALCQVTCLPSNHGSRLVPYVGGGGR